jgi:hypothetical protein
MRMTQTHIDDICAEQLGVLIGRTLQSFSCYIAHNQFSFGISGKREPTLALVRAHRSREESAHILAIKNPGREYTSL